MEMESNLMMKNQKLEAFDILRKALVISARNTNFFIFTILTSLPLFCFLVYYESVLQKFLVQISEILKQPLDDLDYVWIIPFDTTRKMNKEYTDGFIHLGLLYLVPLHLLELSTVLVVVDLASKMYTEERPLMTLKEMLHIPLDKTRLKGTFITYLYFLVFSTCALLGLIWLATTYFVLFKGAMYDLFFAVWCGPSFAALLTIYLAWSAVWNGSLVISVLEGTYGIKAFALAIYFSSGSEWRGILLMLMFFAWEVSLRLPCIYIGCYGRGINYIGVVAQISLFCFGNVVKWVTCTIYFRDCKNRALEKRLMMKGTTGESCG
ncbi:uncharacterized protein LOC117616717 [Prunus dulcis]|uniref:uncharacterized protein LOC117616717 n=1 Tax=Prunus dulcis TaxID=3755 RepID=UPI001481E6A3|nr:uncharacterized protein LOC117616717 [Prunus dulcis]